MPWPLPLLLRADGRRREPGRFVDLHVATRLQLELTRGDDALSDADALRDRDPILPRVDRPHEAAPDDHGAVLVRGIRPDHVHAAAVEAVGHPRPRYDHDLPGPSGADPDVGDSSTQQTQPRGCQPPPNTHIEPLLLY